MFISDVTFTVGAIMGFYDMLLTSLPRHLRLDKFNDIKNEKYEMYENIRNEEHRL
jgi:hypothetical protein